MGLELAHAAMSERPFMRRFQDDAWRLAGLIGLLPTGGAETPPIAGFKPGKTVIRHWGRQIVSAGFGESEKVVGDDGADRVAASILAACVATAIAEEARHRARRAGFQRLTEDVAALPSIAAAFASLVAEHASASLGRLFSDAASSLSSARSVHVRFISKTSVSPATQTRRRAPAINPVKH